MSCVSQVQASPEIVPLAEEEVALGVEAVAHLAQSAVAAPALETVLVPEHVQGLQMENIIFMVNESEPVWDLFQ